MLSMGEDDYAVVVNPRAEVHLEVKIQRRGRVLADDHIVEGVPTGRAGDGRRVLVGLDGRIVFPGRQRGDYPVEIFHTRP